ncbi:MAG: hypothetical protein NTZ05_13995 [Chloroflexi bacterium]|nr:hypothetical protein [Chloroflexota bacterium]
MADLQDRYETAITLLSEMWVRSGEDVEELLEMFTAWRERLPDLVADAIDAVQQDVEDEDQPLTFSQGVGNLSETLVELIQNEAVEAIAGDNDRMADRLNGVVFNHEGVPGKVTGNEHHATDPEIAKLLQVMRDGAESASD